MQLRGQRSRRSLSSMTGQTFTVASSVASSGNYFTSASYDCFAFSPITISSDSSITYYNATAGITGSSYGYQGVMGLPGATGPTGPTGSRGYGGVSGSGMGYGRKSKAIYNNMANNILSLAGINSKVSKKKPSIYNNAASLAN